MNRPTFRTIATLALLALAVQFAATAAVAHLRGSALAYAFQSPDAAEYVNLARGLAREGRFVPLDDSGRSLGPPDTWRVPGYPLFLALIVRCAGDNAFALLLAQQVLAAVAVPLFYCIMIRFASRTVALLVTLVWMLDPFRLYYSQWLLAESLFLLLFLAGVLVYVRAGERSFPPAATLLLGLLTGAVVMVRPIGILLPLLACLGTAWSSLIHADRRRWLPSVLCVAGIAVVTFPWLARNHALAGRWSLSHQSGASFAYHKVTDVILWSQGRHRYRFDAAALDEVRGSLDERLREKYQQRLGPLTPEQRRAFSWRKINFGESDGLDPFVVSSLLWEVGCEELANRKADLLACFAVQGAGMLIFPLNLVIDPPAGQGSAPLSILGGGSSSASRVVAGLLGSAYAALAIVVVFRVLLAVVRRRRPDTFFLLWPAITMFVLILPFEDPRFRLPLIPLFLILGAGTSECRRNATLPVPRA